MTIYKINKVLCCDELYRFWRLLILFLAHNIQILQGERRDQDIALDGLLRWGKIWGMTQFRVLKEGRKERKMGYYFWRGP